MTPDPRPFSLRARREDGFTLIELLVAIVILGVLAAVVVFSVRGIGDKGRENAVAADAATLRTAEEAYCAKYGRYASIDDLKEAKLLRGDPVYNMVAVGNEKKCGRGESSSFTLYGTSPMENGASKIPVGASPVDLAVDEKADRVYVVASGSKSVTVIDGRTDTPIGSPIDVSSAVSTPTRIAVNTGTGQVYVGGTGGLAVIDTANADRVTRIDFPAAVSAVAVSPENGEVYVAGGTTSSSTVAYIAAGSAEATQISLPAGVVVSGDNGTDFAFDASRHAVYLAKSNVGTGATEAASIGLFAISSETHTARIAWKSPTKSSCNSYTGDNLLARSVIGSVAVDPHRNLVYLLAERCVAPKGSVRTTIAVNPTEQTAKAIDEPVGAKGTPIAAAYSSAAGSVYVYANAAGSETCGGYAGRIVRIAGTKVMGQSAACGATAAGTGGNQTHKMAVLNSLNRVFAAQMYEIDKESGRVLAPGGLAVADGTTYLTQAPLGPAVQFTALAVNNKTAKVYALDPAGTVAVFRTGSA
ncbi:prepilin-type N-terminal cleavage/methylation domain-containing protein [Streptomyces sp. NPDC059695]|uniref:prepilin-type N-terminal cleavage/methylation domain-containing protein n=1 Tax=Streptomyces sp. NPDC059695 TaxID=3346910 RepID=UPI0036768E09